MKERIEIVKGDVTLQKVDAIVVSANKSLIPGTGIEGAIYRMGGQAVDEACRLIGCCETGQAVITPAGKLAARFLIHAVGPVWAGGNFSEAAKLRLAYNNSLNLAVEQGLRTIAFTGISTGEYRFPKPMAANIAYKTIMSFLDNNTSIKRVIFCCNDEEIFRIMQKQRADFCTMVPA